MGLTCRSDRPVAPTKSDQTAMEPIESFRWCLRGGCEGTAVFAGWAEHGGLEWFSWISPL